MSSPLSIPATLEKKALEMESKLGALKPYEKSQIKAFTAVINKLLKEEGSSLQLNDICRDLRNGFLLYSVIGLFTRLPFRIEEKEAYSLFQCHSNVSQLFNYLRKTTGTSINDHEIVEGTSIVPFLGILWHIILHYSINASASSDPSGKAPRGNPLQVLLDWVNSKTAPNYEVSDFTTSFVDGKALAYLVSSLRTSLSSSSSSEGRGDSFSSSPDGLRTGDAFAESLISSDPSLSESENQLRTIRNAFDSAKDLFGVEAFVTAEEFHEEPNKETNVAYLSLFQAQERFAARKKLSRAQTEEEQRKLQAELERREAANAEELRRAKDQANEERLELLERLRALEEANKAKEEELAVARNKLPGGHEEAERLRLLKENEELRALNEDLTNGMLGLRRMLNETNARVEEFKNSLEEERRERVFLETSLVQKGELDFDQFLAEKDVELRIPTLGDFENVDLSLLSSDRKTRGKPTAQKWVCSNCSYRNSAQEALCRNCFFVNPDFHASRRKITPSDFSLHKIVLDDPVSYQLTWVFFVKTHKHILKLEHEPGSDKRRVILDGNVLKKKKKRFWRSSHFSQEFWCNDVECSVSVLKQKEEGRSSSSYFYYLYVGGKEFEAYRDEYFRERGIDLGRVTEKMREKVM